MLRVNHRVNAGAQAIAKGDFLVSLVLSIFLFLSSLTLACLSCTDLQLRLAYEIEMSCKSGCRMPLRAHSILIVPSLIESQSHQLVRTTTTEPGHQAAGDSENTHLLSCTRDSVKRLQEDKKAPSLASF